MYSVVPCLRPSACSALRQLRGQLHPEPRARVVHRAGRGWSVGSSSSSGAPASARVQ